MHNSKEEGVSFYVLFFVVLISLFLMFTGLYLTFFLLQFPITALREIKILKLLCHDNIIQLLEMAVERKSAFVNC
jgi:hypothetical protein